MAKDKRPKPQAKGQSPAPPAAQPDARPDARPDAPEDVDEAVDDAAYTEHLLVPLPFKDRLERIAQDVNQERRRRRLPKRPLGWFVVKYLQEWMDLTEAAKGGPPPGAPS